MMIALGFVGVVTTKEMVLDKITKYLREGVDPRTFKHWKPANNESKPANNESSRLHRASSMEGRDLYLEQEGGGDGGLKTATLHEYGNFANYLYGYTILNSSATPCLYVVSKRICEGPCGDAIHTQLWSGFATSLATTESKKVMVVDLGSGEFKRFVCQIKDGEAVKLLEEFKDKTYPGRYKEALKKIVKVLKGKFAEESKNEKDEMVMKFPKGDDIPPDDYKEPLDEIITSIFMGKDPAIMEKDVESVHFIATSSSRKFFAYDSKLSTKKAKRY
jgi:hypothetical protein